VYLPAFAFAASRPYLGVHYPSDVVAGALLGSAIAAAWPAPSVEPTAGEPAALGLAAEPAQ